MYGDDKGLSENVGCGSRGFVGVLLQYDETSLFSVSLPGGIGVGSAREILPPYLKGGG